MLNHERTSCTEISTTISLPRYDRIRNCLDLLEFRQKVFFLGSGVGVKPLSIYEATTQALRLE